MDTDTHIDNLKSDVVILGGEESVKQITHFFSQILETNKKKKKKKKERKRYQLNEKKSR